MKLIDKDALVAEIKNTEEIFKDAANKAVDTYFKIHFDGCVTACRSILSFIDTLEVKEIDLIIHTIIAECCDWLAMNTNIGHDKIEDCRNLMLTVKEEKFKAKKGE